MATSSRAFTVLLAAVLAAGACGESGAVADRDPRPQPAAWSDGGATPLPELGIPAAALVAPGIYRGGQPDAAGFRALRALGVRTVLDLRATHDERDAVRSAGMEPVALPMPGGRAAPAPRRKQIEAFLALVSDPARRPIFVHCSHGKDRTGVLFAIYRMEVDGWPRERAIAEMRALGAEGDHPAFERFVREYEPRNFRQRVAH